MLPPLIAGMKLTFLSPRAEVESYETYLAWSATQGKSFSFASDVRAQLAKPHRGYRPPLKAGRSAN